MFTFLQSFDHVVKALRLQQPKTNEMTHISNGHRSKTYVTGGEISHGNIVHIDDHRDARIESRGLSNLGHEIFHRSEH